MALAALYAGRVMLMAWRGDPALADLRLPHWSHTFSYVAGLVAILFTTMGYVLMHKERAESAQTRLAMVDALTGIANRRAILDTLERSLAQARRSDRPMALLLLDIDHFKQVNDRHGHLCGDAVLAEVARRLHRRVRAQDQIGRYGGEEFLAVLNDTGMDGARVLAEDLRQVCAHRPVTTDGQSIDVTVSIGVSVWQPGSGAGIGDQLLTQADGAMYQSKQQGRNRVTLADALDDAVRSRIHDQDGKVNPRAHHEQPLHPPGI